VQTTVEAGRAEPTGEVAGLLHRRHGHGVVVLEAGDRYDRDGQHLGIRNHGQRVRVVPRRAEQVIDHDVGGYNQVVVHARASGWVWRS
jgi:hypothetical protein